MSNCIHSNSQIYPQHALSNGGTFPGTRSVPVAVRLVLKDPVGPVLQKLPELLWDVKGLLDSLYSITDTGQRVVVKTCEKLGLRKKGDWKTPPSPREGWREGWRERSLLVVTGRIGK